MKIENAWKQFRKIVIPQDAPAGQVRDMRNTFYAGAATVMHEFAKAMDEDEDGHAACNAMQEILQECSDFRDKLTTNRN